MANIYTVSDSCTIYDTSAYLYITKSSTCEITLSASGTGGLFGTLDSLDAGQVGIYFGGAVLLWVVGLGIGLIIQTIRRLKI